MASGAAWMILARIAERSLGLLSTLFLVRLLVPADFGLVAMGTTILAVVEIMGAFGFDTVLIYRQSASRPHYDTAWTFNVIVATGGALVLLALAAPAAQFYNEPRLIVVIALMALSSWVQGFENIGVVDFRKSLEFNREFLFLLSKKLVSFAVTVPLAFALRNYWALVIGTVVSKFAGVLASYVLHPYRPRFSLAAKADLFHFSKWLFLNNLILLVRDRSAEFAIGRILGPHDLGLYSISHEISDLPTQQLTAPVNRAVFPAYAKQAHDLAQLRSSFLQVVAVLWLIALPVGAGIALTASLFVPVVLGPNWLEAVPILRILTVFGTLMVMQANIGYVFYALGTPRTTMLLTLWYVVVLLPLLIVLTKLHGAVGTAWAHLASAAVFVPASLAVVFRRLSLPVGEFAKSVWRTVAAVAVMSVAVRIVIDLALGAGWSSLAALVAGVATGVAAYPAAVGALWTLTGRPDGPEKLLIEKLAGLAKRESGHKLAND
jgi:lipopolysaccharide exporter